MKYSEFHRLVKEHGWRVIRAKGSHYIYEKNGVTFPVPFHGSNEVLKGLEIKMKKENGN